MIERGDKFKSLDQATIFDGGESVSFTIKSGGKEMRVNCAIAELGDIFSFLGQLAKAAGEARNVPAPPVPKTHNYLAPVPAEGMGLQRGNNPDEVLLVIRLFGFDMAFAVPSNAIVRLADDFLRMAHALSSGSQKSSN